MVIFKNLSHETPYKLFKEKFEEALECKQDNINAMSISTYNIDKNEVDSRFVNLKIINKKEFIFFTNYESPKAQAFKNHPQISALFFWPTINTQVRMKAKIKKTPTKYNQIYFEQRSLDKNALAISSNQSFPIDNFDCVIQKYNKAKQERDLKTCPRYWGGYSFIPYQMEFWTGDKHRLNKRSLYTKAKSGWIHSTLQP